MMRMKMKSLGIHGLRSLTMLSDKLNFPLFNRKF